MYNKNKDRMANREKFYGNYRGEVVSVDDPYGAGRIRVEVFGVFDDMPVGALPWAIFADPLMGGQGDLGGFFVPDVGSHVWLFFEEGDHTQPVYFAGAPARPHGPSQASNGYPRNKVFKTKAGHYVEFDDAGERIKLHHTSGTETEIDSGGNVDQYVVSNVTQQVDGDVTQSVDGDVTQSIDGDVKQSIEGKVEQNVNGGVDRTVNGDVKETINGSYNRTVSGDVNDQASGSMSLGGSPVNLN